MTFISSFFFLVYFFLSYYYYFKCFPYSGFSIDDSTVVVSFDASADAAVTAATIMVCISAVDDADDADDTDAVYMHRKLNNFLLLWAMCCITSYRDYVHRMFSTHFGHEHSHSSKPSSQSQLNTPYSHSHTHTGTPAMPGKLFEQTLSNCDRIQQYKL